jgi:hypothetical protein
MGGTKMKHIPGVLKKIQQMCIRVMEFLAHIVFIARRITEKLGDGSIGFFQIMAVPSNDEAKSNDGHHFVDTLKKDGVIRTSLLNRYKGVEKFNLFFS